MDRRRRRKAASRRGMSASALRLSTSRSSFSRWHICTRQHALLAGVQRYDTAL